MMNASEIVQAAIKGWESADENQFATYLADGFTSRGFWPTPVSDSKQTLNFIKIMTTAFPDWSFNGHVLDTVTLRTGDQRVLVATMVTGTHSGDLVLPGVPIVLPTRRTIALPTRHLEFIVRDGAIVTTTANFSPNALEEVLGQLGLVLPR